ncbi:hypothetical protein [Corynebacterium ulceribovis]|uniref:hypothetical protein n=1 Tax=Corynebacterium ulceribovis TaxID=487732 RepID=UPI00038168AE|nr:hypothetical protein [Corynebacterium ulceribovis]
MQFRIIDQDGRECWTSKQCAEFIDVALGTWQAYVSRGRAPESAGTIDRMRLWRADDVRTWDASRPGPPGARR